MKAKHLAMGLLSLVLVLALAVPSRLAAANKLVFKASLTTGAELHEVVDSSARGSAVFTSAQNGSFNFILFAHGLSGPATGAHLHGPADASQTAPVYISLCGSPTPAVSTTCTVDADGNLYVTGNIGSSALMSWGISGAQFMSDIQNGLLYVNVHTALNPSGEIRGQVLPQ
jgi:hypothetical protein